jgi:hypothetical protein
MANMSVYTDPADDTPLEERVEVCLSDGKIKTFSQLEVLCGIADPRWAMQPEEFSQSLDAALSGLIACGKVLLVAKRPELCFRKGTVLDRILKETDGDS